MRGESAGVEAMPDPILIPAEHTGASSVAGPDPESRKQIFAGLAIGTEKVVVDSLPCRLSQLKAN
jgi:hypothetical protein